MRTDLQVLRDAEEKIRVLTATKGTRINEYFQDYDRLRSGYVTKNQFKRVLDQVFKIGLLPQEEELLFSKYNYKNDEKINYRDFCKNIAQVIPDNDLSINPEAITFKNPEYLGTFKSTYILDNDNMRKLENLLRQMSTYYKRNGIDILTCLHDFDKANSGAVTEPQFLRGLTEPNLTNDELELLLNKYRDPSKPGKVNYMNLHYDLLALGKSVQFSDTISYGTSDTVFVEPDTRSSVQEILDKVLLATHKNGIRISDFFKDYDRLRSGVITEHQFMCALSLAVEKQANLSRTDISKLVEYYKKPDGRCHYKVFTDLIDNGFNVPELEKKPTTQIHRPPSGLLGRLVSSNLSPEDEEAVQRVLERMSEKVHKRRLQVFPFFKDFDRSKAYTRNVTKLQFGRALSMLDLMPSPNEFRLLCDKFEEKNSGDISYPSFCHAIDDEWFASVVDKEPESDESKPSSPEYPSDTTVVNVNDLMGRIRSHILGNRIRVKEFFEDMDPLRSSKISKARFVRCLSFLGISSIGAVNLNKAQLQALCERYEDQDDSLKVNWKRFENDIDTVFTIQNLEKDPNIRVPKSEIYEMAVPGTTDFQLADDYNQNDFNNIMQKWKSKVAQRRIYCWPPFQDFDKLNRGHVTLQQFRQCCVMLDLNASEAEMTAVAAKYVDDQGFNYYRFMSEIHPTIVEPPKYSAFAQELVELNSNKVLAEYRPSVDVQSVLTKLKDAVVRRRIRIYEWLRDHDKLNSGRIPKETFRRALDLCNFELKELEYSLLEDYFQSPKDSRSIEYKRLCTEIESIFSDNQLEKNPLLEPEKYHLERSVARNRLSPDSEDLVAKGLRAIAERVRRQRIQLFPKFEDFDRVRNGFVSQSQFRRVLNDLDLESLLNELEYKKVCEKFSVQIGTRDDIDYNTFCDTLYEIGGFEHRRP